MKNINITKTKLFFASLTAVIVAITTVQADPSRGHHQPPQESIDACVEKTPGEACSFSHREHDVEGTCFSPADDKPLACRPNRPKRPPTVAVNACAEKTEGDNCSFEHRDQVVEGACRLSPEGEEPLACAPQRRRRHRS